MLIIAYTCASPQELGYTPDFIRHCIKPLIKEIKQNGLFAEHCTVYKSVWYTPVYSYPSFLCSLSALPSVCRVGIRVVANAGGINLLACAEMVKKVASEEGVDLSVAMVTGDDLMKKVSRVRVAIPQGPVPPLLNFFCCYFY